VTANVPTQDPAPSSGGESGSSSGPATPASLSKPDFTHPGRGKEGYVADEVDQFVAKVRRSVRADPPSLAPYEVSDEMFGVTRRGRRYVLREVDDYLDAAEDVLREVHGQDAVAGVEGRRSEDQHVRTWWIYAIAVLLVAGMVAFALTQL
jgi:hypothetical protein